MLYAIIMETFQAKSIQKSLRIPRFRYDYILLKIAIKPDIEQATGRGKTNLFSFKKLVEFAIASTAIDIGMSANSIIKSLSRISIADRDEGLQVFSPEIMQKSLCYHMAWSDGTVFSLFSGDVCDSLKVPYGLEFPAGLTPHEAATDPVKERKIMEILRDLPQKTIIDAEGYSTLNLMKIKNTAISRL